MTPLTRAKLALATAGLLVWAYGARAEDVPFQWGGMALLVGAFLLRFLNRRGLPRDRS